MSETIRKHRRLPAVATVLALIGPGLGHFYSGKLPHAIAWALIFLVFSNVFFLLLVSESVAQSDMILFLIFGTVICLVHALFAWRTTGKQAEDFKSQPYNRWYYYVIWWLSVVFMILFTAPQLGNYRVFRSPSNSMEAALMWNERLVANMDAYDKGWPERGDVVIFICPCDGTTLYLKRCMAVPGDTIEIVDKKFYVNGAPVEEPATVQFIDTTETGGLKVHPKLPGAVDSRDNYGPHEVPAGEFFMVGDNRDNSYDSRFFGSVPKKMILGKAIRVYFSSDFNRILRLID